MCICICICICICMCVYIYIYIYVTHIYIYIHMSSLPAYPSHPPRSDSKMSWPFGTGAYEKGTPPEGSDPWNTYMYIYILPVYAHVCVF